MQLLVTGAFPLEQAERKILADQGWQILEQPDEAAPLPADPADIDAVICNHFFDNHAIEEFPNLRLIQLTSAGTDQIAAAVRGNPGIRLYNAKAIYSIPIAEWTISKILEICKASAIFYEQQKQRLWQKQRDLIELQGLTAMILAWRYRGAPLPSG
jgi:phosphoglycerate dehydrogenase-like enzyme